MKVYLDDERIAPDGWTQVRWPDEAIELLKTGQVTHLSLDHDLGDDERGTGYDVVLWVEKAVATEGYEAIAVALLFSFKNPAHELAVKEYLQARLPEGEEIQIVIPVTAVFAPQAGDKTFVWIIDESSKAVGRPPEAKLSKIAFRQSRYSRRRGPGGPVQGVEEDARRPLHGPDGLWHGGDGRAANREGPCHPRRGGRADDARRSRPWAHGRPHTCDRVSERRPQELRP